MTTRSSPTRWRAGSARRGPHRGRHRPGRERQLGAAASGNAVDVVALDLDLAGEDGLRLGREILAAWPDIGIVVVTGAPEEVPRVLEAVQMGVRGWVDKADTADTLVAAVRGGRSRREPHPRRDAHQGADVPVRGRSATTP